MRRTATIALSGLLVAIGVVLVVETALAGGQLGYLFGLLFVLAGLGRGYLAFSASRTGPSGHSQGGNRTRE